MASPKPLATAAGMLRSRLIPSLRTRGGGGGDRWTSPGHQDRPNGYLFNRTPPPPGQSRKWEDWELPCYITSFLTIVILGVGLNAKPDLTLETWAHQKALERLQAQNLAPSSDSSDSCPYGLACVIAKAKPSSGSLLRPEGVGSEQAPSSQIHNHGATGKHLPRGRVVVSPSYQRLGFTVS
ncbi:hypothetical protein Cgig2_012121 [Carnegiea gigantea]|uniref:NADH dehydrogenase [ubiquinone] 1 beta subcomplex subunit 11, mitochondrial n=1 Tax=Carnegiea gigantea TaxID=171969 RepID=A0A9Q1KS89_9CARY|nr:hypothetical protein Cgig2_012121 [Carnegiea gigantea]